jgi:prophage antirepressor-like protein
MIRTHYDSDYEYYLAPFENLPVKILKDRKTGEILFDAASVAACLGYQSTTDMMSRDEVLDVINTHIKETGESPLKRV